MQRIITGLLAIICWLALLYSQSFLLLWMTITIIVLIGSNEFYKICLTKDERFLNPFFIATSLLPLLAAFYKRADLVFFLLVFSLVLNTCLTVITAAKVRHPFELLMKANFGSFYVGLFSAFLPLIMAGQNGAAWLLFLTTITAASDSGAYFVGRAMGRNKLCPSISPGKTVEGFIGGLVCGTVVAVLVGIAVFDRANILPLALIAFILSALGVVGDLAESLLKRSMGVKDSGTLLPGHGGILDRVDSLLLTAPVLYYILFFNLAG